jgi:hypothetical protein
MAIVVRSTESLAVRDSTNSTVPSGGCRSPIMRLSTITRPKWTRSMPRVLQIGMRMGTSRVIAATGSRKHPMKSIKRFASSRNTQGVWVNESTQAATASVTRVTVRSQPKIDAAATISSTVAVVSIVSIEIFTSILISIVRYHTSPSARA